MPIETPETVGSLGRCALSVVAGISPSQHAVHRLQLLPAYIDHDMAGYQTPEAAAMAGLPPEYCRVVASEANGDCAYVLLDTGSPGQPYLYGVNCVRVGAEWQESSSGNGGGWSLTDERTELGVWCVWDDVEPEADLVRVEFDGRVSEHPVRNGIYFVVWWNQPVSIEPTVMAIRVHGKWIEHPWLQVLRPDLRAK